MMGPLIENAVSGGNHVPSFSGRFLTNNPSSIRIFGQSNMFLSGSGFTRATPVLSAPPVIHGFSEIISGTITTMEPNGRQNFANQIDNTSDDVYLHESSSTDSERLSKSTFGFPVNYFADVNDYECPAIVFLFEWKWEVYLLHLRRLGQCDLP